jgi:hypothetical protein
MAVPYHSHLGARLRARFHVQVQITDREAEPGTPAAVPVKGRVVRVFRSDGALNVGDEVLFSVHVRRKGDDIWPGPSFMLYETFANANHMELFLDGNPPQCEVLLDECIALDGPTRRPRLRASRLEYLIELVRWKFQ